MASRAADNVDSVGTWKCEYEIGGKQLTATLTIKKDGDKLSGTMSWPDQKDANLKDVKLKDSALTFSAVRKFMDNEFPLAFTLTIKKDVDKLAGTMSWPNQKETNLEGLKLKDDTLTFSAVRRIMDNEITVEYTLAIDGDKFKGKGAAEFGGQKQEFDINGKREKKDK